MSVPFDPYVLTRKCNEDLAGKEYHLVRPNGDDDITLCSALGQLPMGALTNDVGTGTASDPIYVPVQVGQIIKVKCGAGITAGNFAGTNASGQARQIDGAHAGGNNNHAFGIALETYVAGDIGAFLWSPCYLTTAAP